MLPSLMKMPSKPPTACMLKLEFVLYERPVMEKLRICSNVFTATGLPAGRTMGVVPSKPPA